MRDIIRIQRIGRNQQISTKESYLILLSVILEGEDVSSEIRTETVGNTASQAATFPRVREALLRRQRSFRTEPGLIADGRDMGTIVFPDAQVKIPI